MALARSLFELPATVLSGISNVLFGSYQKNKHGEYKTDDDGKYKTNPGLFGYLFMGIAYAFRAVSNFVSNHKTAIATAFWASLVLAGAAALTVALWPAALAAVTTFSIAGLSIAAIVGTGFAAQVGAVAGLTAIATSAAVYAGATVVNAINGVRGWFANRAQSNASRSSNPSRQSSLMDDDYDYSSSHLSGLGSSVSASKSNIPAPSNSGRQQPLFDVNAVPFTPAQPEGTPDLSSTGLKV